MKRRLYFLFSVLLVSLVALPHHAWAQPFVRENQFWNQQGVERTAQIKKFQASHNLPIDGTLNDKTIEMLYNPNRISYDKVDQAPTDKYWIAINKTTRILTVYQGKEVYQKYPVATGKSNSPTPTIKTRIVSKQVNPAWNSRVGKAAPGASNNPLGYRWMGLIVNGSYGYGIHGNANVHSIGTYASMGCVRMFNYDVENNVFPVMSVGDPVWIGNDEDLRRWGVAQEVDYALPPEEVAWEIPADRSEKPFGQETLPKAPEADVAQPVTEMTINDEVMGCTVPDVD